MQLKIVTYNVYMDGYKDEISSAKTVQAIKDADADIICLQECSKGWREVLENPSHDLVSQYPHIHFHIDIFSYGGRALFSKFPIVETQWLDRVFRFWYGALWAKIQLPGAQVAVLNLHLRAPFPGLPFRVQDERLKELKQFWSQLSDDQRQNMIVLGDMNTARGLPHNYLQDKGYKNALYLAGKSLGAKTWNIKGVLGFLFDHIYYDSRSFEVESAHVMKVGGSDHWPLTTTLQLRDDNFNSQSH